MQGETIKLCLPLTPQRQFREKINSLQGILMPRWALVLQVLPSGD